MHGLAKMRELDLRLARTTQKARELRRMARDAAEEAERAAGVGLAQVQKTSMVRSKVARVSATSTQHGSLLQDIVYCKQRRVERNQSRNHTSIFVLPRGCGVDDVWRGWQGSIQQTLQTAKYCVCSC